MSSYPRSWTYPLSRLNNFSRQKYRILTQAQTTFGPNDQIVVDLPVGILDMSTFTMHGQLVTSVAGGATPSVKAPFVEGLIESIYVEAGGVAIQNITNYGQLFNIFKDYQLADKTSFRGVMQNDRLGGLNPNSTTEGPGVLADNVTDNKPFAIYNWLGILSTMKVWDTTLWPQIRLYIRLAPTSVLSVKGAPTAFSYTLSQVKFSCDVVDIADGVYSQMINQKLRSAPLEIPYDNVTTVVGSLGAKTSSTRWSTSAHCLEGVIATALNMNYADNVHSPETGLSTYFRRHGEDMTQVQFTVNGVPYPSIPMSVADGDVFVNTAHALNVSQDALGSCNPAMRTLDLWNNHFFTAAQSFTYDADGDDSRLCGLDGRGSQLLGTVNFTGNGANVIPVVFLRHKSLARVGAGKLLEVVL